MVQTVVSGNVRAVAEIKLATFGLDQHIVWDHGAYGEDADERADLVRIALHRSGDVDPNSAVLFGDTPADIAAALAAQVPVVAVATGRSSVAELRDAGAENVLPDLRDVGRIAELVAG